MLDCFGSAEEFCCSLENKTKLKRGVFALYAFSAEWASARRGVFAKFKTCYIANDFL